MENIKVQEMNSKKFIGMFTQTSVGNSQAVHAWKKFMPAQKDVLGKGDGIFFSIQEYPEDYFNTFDPNANFITWAAKEVDSFDKISEEFSKVELMGGLYVTFLHKGTAADIGESIGYMFGQWIPENGYEIDTSRKHFEVIEKNYGGPSHPKSEEVVWIPIIKRA